MNWIVDGFQNLEAGAVLYDEMDEHDVLNLAIHELSMATDEASIGAIMASTVYSFGMDNFVYASCGSESDGSARMKIVNGYDPRWLEVYLERGYINSDPTLVHCLNDSRPLFWDSLDLINLEEREQELMEVAKCFGLRTGISIPIHRAGDFGVVSITSKSEDKETISNRKQIAPFIAYLVTHVHEAARRIGMHGGFKDPTPSLTVREMECLRWAAAGKTSWDTSTILSISERTVVFHLRNATAKLGASTKTQAVARAYSLGVIKI
jgi:LuxR family transcriptional activator of bioluminescence operon